MRTIFLESAYKRDYRQNLGLARLSSIYKSDAHTIHHAVLNSKYKYPKGFVPDKVVISATFSWDLPYLKRFYDELLATFPSLRKKGKVEIGGVCTLHMKDYIINNFGITPHTGCSKILDHIIPDFEFGKEYITGKIEKQSSYLFTQRGCPRGCPWCIVPKHLEPEPYTITNWMKQIDMSKKYVVLYDNNIMSTCIDHKKSVFGYLTEIANKKGIKVNGSRKVREVIFDSGFDFRYFNESNLELIKDIKFHKIKLSWDSIAYEKEFDYRVRMLLSYFPKVDKHGIHRVSGSNIEAYVLYNCPYTKDSLEDTLYRVYKLRKNYGILPYLMRYQPLDTLQPKSYLSPHWNGMDATDISRWTNNRYIFLACERYLTYKGRDKDGKCLSKSDSNYNSFANNASKPLSIDFSKTFKENLHIISREIKERDTVLKRYYESCQMSFAV